MLWHCETCKTLYAPELPACPQCGGHDYRLAPGGEPIGDVLSSALAAAPAPAAKKQRAAAATTAVPTSEAPAAAEAAAAQATAE